MDCHEINKLAIIIQNMDEAERGQFAENLAANRHLGEIGDIIKIAENPDYAISAGKTPPLHAYIENVHDEGYRGGFTIPLPTTMSDLQPYLNDIGAKGWQDIKTWEVTSEIEGLGEILSGHIVKSMSPHTLEELNHLAVSIERLGSHDRDVFAAAVAAKAHCGSIAEIINMTENIGNYDLQPAFDAKQYGEFQLDTQKDETADIFNRLEQSDDSNERAFARYVARLEASADLSALGRAIAKEENGAFTSHGYLMEVSGIFKETYRGHQDIPAEHRIFTKPGEDHSPLIKTGDINIPAALVKMCATNGDYTRSEPAEIIKEITAGKDRDYLLTINTNGHHFYPALDAYRRGGGPAGIITSLTGEPGTRFFALRLDEAGKPESGSLLEINRDALYTNMVRHHITPGWMEAEMSDGTKSSLTIWDWSNLDGAERGKVVSYEPIYSTEDSNKIQKRFDDFRGECNAAANEVTEAELLADLNKAYMAAAKNPLPDMIRVENEAAKEILARGDADVYRLTPGGAEKLSPIDAAKPLCFKENRDLAIRREDISGLDKWADRAAAKLIRQNERGEREKPKHKEEQL